MLARIKNELIALIFTVIPVNGNSNLKKIFAIALLSVWIILTLASAFGECNLSSVQYQYTLLTAAVFLLFGRLWGLEYERLFGK